MRSELEIRKLIESANNEMFELKKEAAINKDSGNPVQVRYLLANMKAATLAWVLVEDDE